MTKRNGRRKPKTKALEDGQKGPTHRAIRDRDKLATTLRAHINADFGGSVNLAAQNASISEPQLRRLTSGLVVSRVSGVTFERLEAFLGKAVTHQLFWSVNTQRSAGLYMLWELEVAHRSMEGTFMARAVLSGSQKGEWLGRREELKTILRRIGNAPDLLEIQDLLTADKLTSEEEWILDYLGGKSTRITPKKRRDGVPVSRYYLALLRSVEPLLDAAVSGWVERRQSEMTDREFRSFVQHGWTREKILLNRKGNQMRSDRVADLVLDMDRPPIRFEDLARQSLPRVKSKPETSWLGGMLKVRGIRS